MMADKEIDQIAKLCKDLQGKLPVNAFSLLSSGTFQLENFHSRVLAGLLDPTQRHGRSKLLMEKLIEMLAKKAEVLENGKVASELRCAWQDGFYDDVEVKTEYPIKSEGHLGRIDILLSNKKLKKAIVIENKINGAPDMSRQLLRYVKALGDEGLEVMAVVYLKLADDSGYPEWSEWTEAERQSVKDVLVPISACADDDCYSLKSWLDIAGTEDKCIAGFANEYLGFIMGQSADCDRWDELCKLVAGKTDEILASDKIDRQTKSIIASLPEYIERRIVYACPPCEFQKSIYSDRYECATFQRYFVGEAQYGDDAPELGLDVTDGTIRFFVREDRKRLVVREKFKRLSALLQRVDGGFMDSPRGRLGQHVISVTDAYDDVGAYTKRVAKIVSALSDSKEAITEALLSD